jgi:hypothetical protein
LGNRLQIADSDKDLSLHPHVQIGSEAHPSTYRMRTDDKVNHNTKLSTPIHLVPTLVIQRFPSASPHGFIECC